MTPQEVLELVQHHIDGYMATDWQTEGRDIMPSTNFVDLYDVNGELFAYMVPLLEGEAEIGYITMPARNTGLTFYEIHIYENTVEAEQIRGIDALNKSLSSENTNSKLYYFPPLDYVMGVEEEGATVYYEVDIADSFALKEVGEAVAMNEPQAVAAKTEETVNPKIEAIINPTRTALAATVAVEDIRLSHEADFVPVVNGSEKFYGGDQRWWASGSTKRTRGCGPVAAANITCYLDEQSSLRKTGLYNYTNLNKTYFLSHMNTLYEYCDPGLIGDFVLSEWISDVVAYASARNVSLSSVRSYSSYTYENECTLIKNGLRKDSPVATLNLDKTWSTYGWHWMTITKYYRGSNDDRFVAVSSWGKRYSINYDLVHAAMLVGGGLVYFT